MLQDFPIKILHRPTQNFIQEKVIVVNIEKQNIRIICAYDDDHFIVRIGYNPISDDTLTVIDALWDWVGKHEKDIPNMEGTGTIQLDLPADINLTSKEKMALDLKEKRRIQFNNTVKKVRAIPPSTKPRRRKTPSPKL